MAAKIFTGKPCKRGHIAERLASSRACCECQRESNRARYLADPDGIKAAVYAHRAAHPEKPKAQRKAWRAAHLESERARDRARFLADKDAHIARLIAWNEANPDRTRARIAAWAKANPGRRAATAAKRRAAVLQRTPAWADHEAIGMMYRAAEVFRVSGFDVHVDHHIPLQGETVSGLHVHTNLRILDARTNRSKSNIFEGARL